MSTSVPRPSPIRRVARQAAVAVTLALAVVMSGPVAATASAAVAMTITVVSGNGQSVPLTATFAPIVVKATDAAGAPAGSRPVTFLVRSGAATFAAGRSLAITSTDSAGRATTPTLTAGAFVGPVTIGVLIDGAPTATVTARVVGSTTATIASGDHQTIYATARSAPFAVKVTGSGGQAVPGFTVTFAVTSGPAYFTVDGIGKNQASAVTDATGVATAPLLQTQLDFATGSVAVLATAPRMSAVTFTHSVVHGPADLEVLGYSAPASVKVGTPFTVVFTLRNNGPAPSTNIKARYGIQNGFTYQGPGGSSGSKTSAFTSTERPIASGATDTIRQTLQASKAGTVTIRLNVSLDDTDNDNTGDPNGANNSLIARIPAS